MRNSAQTKLVYLLLFIIVGVFSNVSISTANAGETLFAFHTPGKKKPGKRKFRKIIKGDKPGGKKEGASKDKAVKIELFMVSKCPFAAKVLKDLAVPLRELEKYVDFKVSYLGTVESGKLSSMHGEKEVSGDKLQVCAMADNPMSAWLSFLGCQSENFRSIPKGWEACAKKANIKKSKLNNCFKSKRSKELLKASFDHSAQSDVTGSPTIFINEEKYRGKRSSDVFSREICKLLPKSKPSYCDSIPEPEKVKIVVIVDKRCDEKGCDAKNFIDAIERSVDGAELEKLDISESRAKKIYKKSEHRFLPIAIFEDNFTKNASYSRFEKRLKKIKKGKGYTYPLGRTWDPYGEICTDKKDNDKDRLVDCKDPDCKFKLMCQNEKKRHLDLFIMSQCPYGNRSLKEIKKVIESFGKQRTNIEFRIDYIGRNENGKLTSLHGENEIAEDKRQLCAQKHYSENYKFLDYVACRAEDFRKSDWQQCATNGIDAAKISSCANGEEGTKLLKESFNRASQLRIGRSPKWLINNKVEMMGSKADQIKEGYCKQNKGVSGCK